MNNGQVTITKAVVFDAIVRIDRTWWVIEGTWKQGTPFTKRTKTRTEAREWCAEMGLQVVAGA